MVYGAPRLEEMQMSNAVVHFEIPADDVARATKFYEKTFGWTIKAFPMPPGEEYYSVVTRTKGAPGIDGGLLKRKMPGQPFTNYINVPSIDEVNRAVEANGGRIMVPKHEIGPNMGWISLFMDPENNMIGLHQAPAAPPKKRAAKKKAPARKVTGARKARKAKKAPRRR
jgi:predicted enzyme related to lactoylglutathione lyase